MINEYSAKIRRDFNSRLLFPQSLFSGVGVGEGCGGFIYHMVSLAS